MYVYMKSYVKWKATYCTILSEMVFIENTITGNVFNDLPEESIYL